MTDRIVKISLLAQVSNYVAGMEQVRRKNVEAGGSAADAKSKFEAQNAAMTQIGTGLLAVGALAAVGVGMAIAKYAEFDKAMSSVQAATHATGEEMSLLTDLAIDAGAKTVFSATEAANAIEELAKAGVSTSDIMGGALAGALDLASAGELGVADAAAIAATAMTQFKLSGSEVPHIADLLAAGAGKAQGSVEDLSAALNQGGLVASQAGLSIEETTGTLAAFASAGLLGSDAGTSLKTMLLALENPSTKAAGVMKSYGIEVYDANGNMKSMAEISGILRSRLIGQSAEARNAALATIFGNDAVRAASVLYDQGAQGIQSWINKTDDAGYAAETAALKLDNLAGDVEYLSGSLDTALIKSGAAADGVLRGLTQAATGLVDIFNGAPPIVQQAALGLGVLTAGAALTGGAFLVAVPKIAEFSLGLATLSSSSIPAVAASAAMGQTAIAKMGTGIAATAKFMTGPWGIALAAGALGVSLLTTYIDSLKASTEEYQNVLANAKSASDLFEVSSEGRLFPAIMDEAISSTENFQAALDDIANNPFAAGLKNSTMQLKGSLKDLGTQIADLSKADLPAAQASFRLLADDMELSKEQQIDLLNSMPAYKEALTAQANELDINVSSTDEAANSTALLALAFGNAEPTAIQAADAYLATADEASSLVDQVLSLIDAMNAANGVGQDAVSANASYQGALANVSTEIQNQKDELVKLQKEGYEAAHGSLDGFVEDLSGFTFTLDENTAQGSANAAMLSDIADKAQTAAEAQYELDLKTMSAKEATDKYVGTLATSRQSLIDQATANGANGDQVQRLADKVFALPPQKDIDIMVRTAEADAAIQRWRDAWNWSTPLLVPVNAKFQAAAPTPDGRENGGIEVYENGGVREGIYAGRPGGILKFAEPNVPWEAFISGKPGQKKRNIGIWEDAGHRLGIPGYQNGGFTGYANNVQYAPSGPLHPAPVTVSPQVSLAGATLNAMIDGVPLKIMITDQIASAANADASRILGGLQR